MNFKLDRGSISFIEVIARVSSMIGIAPYYNFKEHKLVYVRLFKCYSILLVALGIISFAFLKHGQDTTPVSVTFSFLLDLTDISGFILFVFATSSSAFWRSRQWQKFYDTTFRLENEMREIIAEGPGSICFLKNPNFLFLVGNIQLVTIFTVHQIFLDQPIRETYVQIIRCSFDYLLFVLCTVMLNVALYIKGKYERINTIICVLTTDPFRHRMADTFRKTRAVCLSIRGVIENFNDLFGYPMLITLLHIIADVLALLDLLSTLLTPKGNAGFDAVNICLAFFSCSWMVSTHLFMLLSSFSFFFFFGFVGSF